MSFDRFYAHHESKLTDFWERRNNAPAYHRAFTVFGRPFQLSSNEKQVLEAVDYSQPLFSTAPAQNGRLFEIQIIVRPFHPSPAPLPDNLFDFIQYSGHGGWLAMQLGGWGHCQMDLTGGRALVVLCLELGRRPEFISRYLLNTIITNFLIASGLGLLHATAVFRRNQLLIMLAGHNSGKSTTALHLALNGFAFVSDSQIYIDNVHDELHLYAFPVGRVKLRPDMLPQFPRLQNFLKLEPVRWETKFRLDLHLVDPALVHDDVILPERVSLCLLARNGGDKTILSLASEADMLEAAMGNSLYYDSAAAWRSNFEQIEKLLRKAACYQLTIGTDVGDIIRVVDELMS